MIAHRSVYFVIHVVNYINSQQVQRPTFAPWYSGILYIDHPKDHSLFGLGPLDFQKVSK